VTRPDDPQRLHKVATAATEFYRAQYLRRGSPAPGYLAARGLAAAGARERPWTIGYAPDHWTALTDHLRHLGYPDQDLLDVGVATRARSGDLIDVFRDRLMFPIFADTTPIAFTARTLGEQSPTNPKYLNTRDTEIYRKGEHLYGLEQQRTRLAAGWTPAIVEGPTDVLAVATSYARSGSPGVVGVAPCGTALTERQFAAVAATEAARTTGIIAAFDADPAGRAATQRLADEIAPTQPHIGLRAVQWPDGADAGALAATPAGRSQLRYLLSRRAEPIAWVVATNLISTYIDHHQQTIRDPEIQLGLARRIAPRLAAQPSKQAFVGMLDTVEQHLRHRLGRQPAGVAAAEGVLRMLTSVLIDATEIRLAATDQPSSPAHRLPNARLPPPAAFPTPPDRQSHPIDIPPVTGLATTPRQASTGELGMSIPQYVAQPAALNPTVAAAWFTDASANKQTATASAGQPPDAHSDATAAPY
jgi:DNA primase